MSISQALYRKPPLGKNLGPAYPWAMMLWISMLPSLRGLHSLMRINLPELTNRLVR
jgi:hypothetical protein